MLELPRGPARVAQCHEKLAGTLAARHGLQDVLGGGQPDFRTYREGGLPLSERGMKHEPAIDLHRPPKMDGDHLQSVAVELDADLLEQGVQVHLDRPVHHDAKGALIVVLADIGERLGEMRIHHVGHGDEKMMR